MHALNETQTSAACIRLRVVLLLFSAIIIDFRESSYLYRIRLTLSSPVFVFVLHFQPRNALGHSECAERHRTISNCINCLGSFSFRCPAPVFVALFSLAAGTHTAQAKKCSRQSHMEKFYFILLLSTASDASEKENYLKIRKLNASIQVKYSTFSDFLKNVFHFFLSFLVIHKVGSNMQREQKYLPRSLWQSPSP